MGNAWPHLRKQVLNMCSVNPPFTFLFPFWFLFPSPSPPIAAFIDEFDITQSGTPWDHFMSIALALPPPHPSPTHSLLALGGWKEAAAGPAPFSERQNSGVVPGLCWLTVQSTALGGGLLWQSELHPSRSSTAVDQVFILNIYLF